MKYSMLLCSIGILICVLMTLSGCNIATANESDSVDPWLGEAYPNPMQLGEATTIKYNLKGLQDVELVIANVLDQEVRKISLSQGASISWNGKDRHGRACASGVYFYYLRKPGDFEGTHKLLLIR